jgi:hypothetical protein
MTVTFSVELESARLRLQQELDSQKTPQERNRLGQFATPTALARELVAYGVSLLPDQTAIRFLDPALGTGAFYSALTAVAPPGRIAVAQGIEFDPHYGEPARQLWKNTPLNVCLHDFTTLKAPVLAERFNLVVCNPPYVRHHHMSPTEKLRLQEATRHIWGIPINGLAGLYCYFLALAHTWMAPDGIAGWLVPSEFMDVKYGKAVRHYLLNKVTLLRIHRYDPHEVQFGDALVSSAVVWFRNRKPPEKHVVELTFGGSLAEPKIVHLTQASLLDHTEKWSQVPHGQKVDSDTFTFADLFTIKRGLATGDNSFFILDEQQVQAQQLPPQFFRPILPSPRFLPVDEILADANQNPANIQRLYLLDCRLPEEQVRVDWPMLWRYLERGHPSVAERYLCRHRVPWYAQEERPAAPLLCTYIGRRQTRSGRPFRFILNHSQAVATNVYLMLYPKPVLATALAQEPHLLKNFWQRLNQIDPALLLAGGRVYGGGMYKLEPNELARLPVAQFAEMIPQQSKQIARQMELFE